MDMTLKVMKKVLESGLIYVLNLEVYKCLKAAYASFKSRTWMVLLGQ